MAFSKIVLNGTTLMDVTQDTVAADKLLSGYTATKNDGTKITGTASGGGGGEVTEVEEKDVNFIDYDGTVVYSYTAEEALALSELPPNPSHSGLVSQGWNWTLQEIKTQLTALSSTTIIVGQLFDTLTGATEIDIELDDWYLDPYLAYSVNGTVDIDWGDGSDHYISTGSSMSAPVRLQHQYPSGGKYTIKLSKVSGEFSLGTNSSYLILGENSTSYNTNMHYSVCVRAVRIGSDQTKIGNYAFYYCKLLEYVTLHNNITEISASSFQNSGHIKGITIPPSVSVIGTYAFYYSDLTKHFSFPYRIGAADMPAYTTGYCDSAKTLYVPYGIESLSGARALSGNSFYKIILPFTLTNISANSIATNYALKELHIMATTPPTMAATSALSNTTRCLIYVPYSEDHSILEAYQTATNWSTYASRMQEEPQ